MAMPLTNMFRGKVASILSSFGARYSGLEERNITLKPSRLFNSYSFPDAQKVSPPVIKQEEDADPESKALEHDDYFQVRDLVTLKGMFKAKVHLGHNVGCRDNFMKPYIFGNRLGMDIIDLEQTKPLLQDALNIAAHVAYRGGIILFVSRSRQTMNIVERTAKDCGEYAHCRYWKGGTFTNANTQFGTVTRLPDLCVFLSVLNSVFETHTAVMDSAKLMIPSVGVVDTNCDPRLVTYPVPGNDDTPKSVSYYCSLFKSAIMAGKQKRAEDGLV